MSITFPIVASIVLVAAAALALWIDRQTTGAPMQEWRDRW